MANKDGTVNQGDATLTVEKPETPNVETYTKEQVEKVVRDTRSAVLADVGRAKKSAEDALARLEQLENERLQSELEAAKDDPAELVRIQAIHDGRKAKAELAQVNSELAEYRESKALSVKEATAKEVATRLQVNAETLIRLAKVTDGSTDAIEAIAKELPKVQKKLKTDSGSMVGGMTTYEEARAAFIKDPTDPTTRAKWAELKAQRKR